MSYHSSHPSTEPVCYQHKMSAFPYGAHQKCCHNKWKKYFFCMQQQGERFRRQHFFPPDIIIGRFDNSNTFHSRFFNKDDKTK